MYVHYTDINECLVNNGGCEFSCTNLEGITNTTGLGYQCGCDSGYQLTPNNHNCTGMCMYHSLCLHLHAHVCVCLSVCVIKDKYVRM